MTHHDVPPNSRWIRRADVGDPYAPVLNETNALGMRGPMPPPKTGFRVLIVGDSTVQASNIAYDETAWARLTRQFAGRADFPAHGIASWAPTTEFAWISRTGTTLQPDEVLLMLDGNDFLSSAVFGWSDEQYRASASYDARGLPVAFNVPMPTRLTAVHDALRRLELFRVGEAAWRRLGSKEQSGHSPLGEELLILDRPAADWPTDRRRNVEQTTDVIRAMSKFLQSYGVRLRVTFVPPPYRWPDEARRTRPSEWPPDLSVGYRGVIAFVRARLESDGIAWIDLVAPFDAAKKANPGTLLYFPIDGHWNPDAHALVSRVLGDYYRDVLAGRAPAGNR